MTRRDNFYEGTGQPISPEYGLRLPKLYHGSTKDLPVGTVLDQKMDFNPNRMAGLDSETEQDFEDMGFSIGKNHPGEHLVFASDNVDYAKEYSHNQSNIGKLGHIYRVEPLNPLNVHHVMPNEFGSWHGFRIVKKGHVTNEGNVHWSHSPEECNGGRTEPDND